MEPVDVLSHQAVIGHLEALELAASDDRYTMDWDEAHALRLWLQSHDEAQRETARDLYDENERLLAENRLLAESLQHCQIHNCDGCPTNDPTDGDILCCLCPDAPATAAEVERVRGLTGRVRELEQREKDALGIAGDEADEVDLLRDLEAVARDERILLSEYRAGLRPHDMVTEARRKVGATLALLDEMRKGGGK